LFLCCAFPFGLYSWTNVLVAVLLVYLMNDYYYSHLLNNVLKFCTVTRN